MDQQARNAIYSHLSQTRIGWRGDYTFVSAFEGRWEYEGRMDRETDSEALLRDYAATGSERAFRELVVRFGGMVHGVALRKTGNRDLAEEASQRVFITLARKARHLEKVSILGAWLHRAAVLESMQRCQSFPREA